MENATQALLIAAGIFFGILVLSLFVYMFGNASNLQGSMKKNEEMERLAEWNEEWEAYNKRILYGAEVLTVFNKAEQNNIDNGNNPLYVVNVKVIDENGNKVTDIRDYMQSRKTSIFECQEMKRNDETGRIQTIVFKFVE